MLTSIVKGVWLWGSLKSLLSLCAYHRQRVSQCTTRLLLDMKAVCHIWYIDFQLSGPHLSEIPNECISYQSILSISVCFIRVFQRSSVYNCTGFNYPNNSLIQTLLQFPENKGVQITITEVPLYYNDMETVLFPMKSRV